MTSRKKIQAITKAAKRLDCAVYLKTGAHPPGIMICECEEGGKEGLDGLVMAVKVCVASYWHRRIWILLLGVSCS